MVRNAHISSVTRACASLCAISPPGKEKTITTVIDTTSDDFFQRLVGTALPSMSSKVLLNVSNLVSELLPIDNH